MKHFWIVNKINPTTAEILLYGYISMYDVSSADFIIELSQLAAIYDTIKIRINSGGGSVFEGIAIHNAIKSFIRAGKNIDTYVDGIAASMAGVIATSGKRVFISRFGRIMTHRAKGYAEGDPDDIRQQANLIESAEDDLAKILSEKTGLSVDQVKEKFMVRGVDKWMTADECIENKLADEVYDAAQVTIPENTTDERALFNLFECTLNKTNSVKNSHNMKELAKLLGLPEDATEAQIASKIAEQNSTISTLQTSAATVAKANAETLVNRAIDEKRITNEKKELFTNMAIKDYEGTKAALEMIPPVKKPTELINATGPVLTNAETTNEPENAAPKGKKGVAWDELVAKGMDAVEKLRSENYPEYVRMYFDKYDRNPGEMGFRK